MDAETETSFAAASRPLQIVMKAALGALASATLRTHGSTTVTAPSAASAQAAVWSPAAAS
ncbi:MAG: hypothetical protein ACFB00_01860 [Parvularculaceae bacterium]